MRTQLKVIALLLAIVSCLLITACAIPQEPTETTPVATPCESTPAATPEESKPTATPEETTSVATPEESTPTATPEESTPVATLDSELPVAENDLTSEQMAEIEAAFGGDIDWDKYYFGTHGGYVYFGSSDGSDEYYSAKNFSKITVYFGYVNAVYAFKDGTVSDAGEIFVSERLSMDLSLTIGGIAIRKTIGELPDINEDFSPDELEALKVAAESKYLPEFYYGIYNGYAVYTKIGQLGEGIKLKVPNENAVELLLVDCVYTYKDGVLAADGRGNLPEGILTGEDLTRIQFIHYALVAELYCEPYGEIY